jgi:very-short-patch-repair endonuclease
LPRRTRLPRSILDAASWSRHDRLARAVVLASVQQRLARPQDLLSHLTRRGPFRRRALIVESIQDASGGVASVPERDFELIRRRRRLPAPSRQAVLRRPDGRYYLDTDWASYGVAAEVHGIQHTEILNWDSDLDRLSVVAARGRRVLQFSSYAVRHRQRRVGDLLAEALVNGGWRPR